MQRIFNIYRYLLIFYNALVARSQLCPYSILIDYYIFITLFLEHPLGCGM